MIGHFLLTLTPEQEDRVLTKPMAPGGVSQGCLLATACDASSLAVKKQIGVSVVGAP